MDIFLIPFKLLIKSNIFTTFYQMGHVCTSVYVLLLCERVCVWVTKKKAMWVLFWLVDRREWESEPGGSNFLEKSFFLANLRFQSKSWKKIPTQPPGLCVLFSVIARDDKVCPVFSSISPTNPKTLTNTFHKNPKLKKWNSFLSQTQNPHQTHLQKLENLSNPNLHFAKILLHFKLKSLSIYLSLSLF